MDNFVEPLGIVFFFATVILPVLAYNWIIEGWKKYSEVPPRNLKIAAFIFSACIFALCFTAWGTVYHLMVR